MNVHLRNVTPTSPTQVWAEIYVGGLRLGEIIAFGEERKNAKGELEGIEVTYFIKISGYDWKIISEDLIDELCRRHKISKESFLKALDRLLNVLATDSKLWPEEDAE